jgi:hypothetical protein
LISQDNNVGIIGLSEEEDGSLVPLEEIVRSSEEEDSIVSILEERLVSAGIVPGKAVFEQFIIERTIETKNKLIHNFIRPPRLHPV